MTVTPAQDSSIEPASEVVRRVSESVFQGLPGLDQVQSLRLATDLVNARLSVIALGPALARLSTTATPSTARAMQATENVWREVADRYGLLTSMEVAELLTTGGANRAFASNLRSKGQLLGVQRRNSYVYPGFQFDTRMNRVKPAIAPLIALAQDLQWDTDELTLWLCSPSGYFAGDRPADHLDDTGLVLQRARDEATVEW